MNKGRWIAVCFVWVVVVAAGVGIYKWIWTPVADNRRESQQEEEDKAKLYATSSDSAYKHNVTFALDSFSGYAGLRTSEFNNLLRQKSIKLHLVDDGADYDARLLALQNGEVQMAAFTLCALIRASSKLGEIPGTVVAVIDETRGADAMMAYKSAMPNVDAMNHQDTKFIITPDSPSETLARVVMAHFNLDQLGSDPFIKVNGAEAVYKMYRQSKPNSKQVFVVWEPYASKMEENPNIHRIIDSSRFRGYIVDVIVVSRDYLLKEPNVVKDVVESYFRAAYVHKENQIELVLADAKKTGTVLSEKQAEKLVDGIWWKNTQENYAHMGLGSGSLQHIEDQIENLTRIFIKVGVIDSDPTNGQPNLLYYNKILEELHAANFHPGIQPEKIRDESESLPKLTNEQWKNLVSIGTLEVPQLVFARGTTRLSDRSNQILNELIGKLKTFPTYYVVVKGDASLRGDKEANKALALERAQATVEYLIEHGVSSNRVRATSVEPTGNTAVNFVLGQMPY